MLTVFTLGLPRAFSYFIPRVDENQAKNLIKKITNLFFLLGGLFSIILFFASDYIAMFLKNPDLAFALKIFSPVPFLMLPTMGLEGILAAFRKTKITAFYTVATRVMMLICVATPVMFFGGGYISAIIGFTIASFISFLLALYLKYYPVKNKGNDRVETSYKEIFKFSLPLLTASLWGVLLQSTDQFFISRYFGTEVFAEFSNGFMDLPFMGMIVGATATVLSPVFSRLNHQKVDPKKEIFPLWISVFKKSAMLVYPLLIYSLVFADVLMVLLYGIQYEDSAIYYRIHNLGNLFKVIVYAPLIINIGEVKFYQNVFMYSALLLIPLEYLSVTFIDSPYAVVTISVIFRVARSIILLIFVSKFFNVRFDQLFPLKLIFKIIIPSFIILILERYILLNLFEMSVIPTLILSFVIYIVLLGVSAKLLNLDYLSILKPMLKIINIKKN